MKPSLASSRMTARRVKASRQEDHVAVDLVDLLDDPLPERERLRVRVVDPVALDAAVDPVQEDVAPGVPQGLPVVGVPVEVVDVLVALGRVLGVLERAVGALLEPLRVLGEPRVVGGGVERDVERHVHAVLVGGGAQVADVLLGAQLRVDGEVAALLAADRVRRAGIVRAGGQRVVAALALVDADRVERQQVEDVEAEVGDVRDELLRRP